MKLPPPLAPPGDDSVPVAAGTEASPVNVDATVQRLAKLTKLDYERVRDEEAARLNVRKAVLDEQVTVARRTHAVNSSTEASPTVKPWTRPVDAAALLLEIEATIQKYIVCDHTTASAAALWIAMTWFIDVIEVAPIAMITAPEKRCGKSHLLTIMQRLVHNPMTASNISPAAFFRCIDAWKPTLLIDEADAFLRANEELRGIINSGHTRTNAFVVRSVGDDHEPKRFSTWGAKAIAGIGKQADTIMDRSIELKLRRKLATESVERLRAAPAASFAILTSKLARFAADAADQVRDARPELPDLLNDRAQDNWEPLLAIADTAGGEWPRKARETAQRLSGAAEATAASTRLLSDIRAAFERLGSPRIASRDLIKQLCLDDDAPWATFHQGRPILPPQLAKLLSGYDIRSKNLRDGGGVLKGYEQGQFEDAFLRYLTKE